ncbi:phosphatase PAP2 family protein [Oculatella sp. LEGE 06141]|nr:phosphatase PAP2 family protein [Oculatella sp. LEGE 06141]
MPSIAWKRWGATLILGFIATDLLAVLVTRIAQFWHDRGLQTWDEQTLLWIAAQAPLSFAQGITWESPGNLISMLPVVITVVAIAVWRSYPLVAVTMATAYVLQFGFAWTGWLLWNRDRPELIADGIAAPGLHSFPSGHALVVCTVYGFIAYLWWRSAHHPIEKGIAIALFVIWIGLISLARLVLGAHWPSDIGAGLSLGIAWLITIMVALNRAEVANRHFSRH